MVLIIRLQVEIRIIYCSSLILNYLEDIIVVVNNRRHSFVVNNNNANHLQVQKVLITPQTFELPYFNKWKSINNLPGIFIWPSKWFLVHQEISQFCRQFMGIGGGWVFEMLRTSSYRVVFNLRCCFYRIIIIA